MGSKDEHIRLFATFLNNAAAGSLVGVVVTLPLAVFSSEHISAFQQVTLELVFAGTAVLLAGAAQFFLWRFG